MASEYIVALQFNLTVSQTKSRGIDPQHLSTFHTLQEHLSIPNMSWSTRWFKYDRDKLWLIYTQIDPVIFEPPCINKLFSRTALEFFLLQQIALR
jgi:hypothetical protein